jgi:hypothetical protein
MSSGGSSSVWYADQRSSAAGSHTAPALRAAQDQGDAFGFHGG